ncbi:MAG: winged helix-turn-helix domain-containing protein [Deltaproteobacteria bacterium]|nr:winged helix-turn-helix domain-containing protein [Deltaproteobacteria bacterium]
MAFILRVSPRMTPREVERAFKSCKDADERLRWQAVMLKQAGRSTSDIAAVCCRSSAWVRRTVTRYNQDGAAGLRDGRKGNGRERLLTAEQEAELSTAIQGDSPDGGLWTGPKVAAWIAEHTGAEEIDPSTGNNYLRRLGFTRQVPRPAHPGADKEAGEAFKKGGFKAFLTTSLGNTRPPGSRSGPRTRRASG